MAKRGERDPEEGIVDFLAGMFRVKAGDVRRITQAPEPPAPGTRMAGVLALQNQPEFWADAPWRLEPDAESLPVSFVVRDANLQPPGRGPWRLDLLTLEQRLPGGAWHKLAAFTAADLAHVDDQGFSTTDFWTFSTAIPLARMRDVRRGDTVHLRAVFTGSFAPHDKAAPAQVHLETLLAEHGLPQGRAARATVARRWFYGDTHYHSAYTNDVKEFGGALAEAQQAARAIGLDWLVVTDHSCDLDEVDLGQAGGTRWQRLKAELAGGSGEFRTILGEEITLAAGGKRLVHMLACGGLEEMVPGAFLPAESGDGLVNFVRKALEKIIRIADGYPVDTPQRLFGRILTLDEVLARLPASTLAFAAHPFDTAQVPPATWEKEDLAHLRLTGFEFWNGRQRRNARSTTNPFAKRSWADPEKAQRRDRERIDRLWERAAAGWDPHLQQGVAEWAPAEPLPVRRPVFIGGSDAHGDFNYHVGCAWDYRSFNTDDDALGRVRTAIEVPAPAGAGVPEAGAILAALRKGACVVTDGPILEIALRQGEREARMGEVLVVDGRAAAVLEIAAHSTPEFGPVAEVEVVTCFAVPGGGVAQTTVVQAGRSAGIEIEGRQGYCRVQARTVGPTGEQFCCFTNPIWLRLGWGEGDAVRSAVLDARLQEISPVSGRLAPASSSC